MGRVSIAQSQVSRSKRGSETEFATIQRLLAGAGHRLYSAPTERDDAATVADEIRRQQRAEDKIQAEAMANTLIEFETSPTSLVKGEDVIYTPDSGHSNAIRALLQKSDFGSIVPALVTVGPYEKTRDEAERTAAEDESWWLRGWLSDLYSARISAGASGESAFTSAPSMTSTEECNVCPAQEM